jgi:hypothetical protein
MDWTSNEIIHEYSSRSTVTQRVSPVDQELQPFRIIRVHPRLLVGLLLLNLLFSVSCFVDHCLSFCPFFFFGHCIFCPSLIYGFWLPLWYLLAIVLSVLPWITNPRSTTLEASTLIITSTMRFTKFDILVFISYMIFLLYSHKN